MIHAAIRPWARLRFLLTVCALAAALPALATQWDITLVTAHGSSTPGNIQSVSDKSTFSGRIHAHATLVATQPVVAATNTFTMKWFSGDRLVHQRSAEHHLSKSPYYLLHAVPGSVLGVGPGRVELHSAAGLVATRQFTIAER
jgi:hypothetical protein